MFWTSKYFILFQINFLLKPVIKAYYQNLLTQCQGGFFEIFKGRGLFEPQQKIFYKSCTFQPNNLKLGTTHLWTSRQVTLFNWSKLWRQHYFSWRNHLITILFVSFSICSWLKSIVFFEKQWLKHLLDVLIHIFDAISNIQNTRKAIKTRIFIPNLFNYIQPTFKMKS